MISARTAPPGVRWPLAMLLPLLISGCSKAVEDYTPIVFLVVGVLVFTWLAYSWQSEDPSSFDTSDTWSESPYRTVEESDPWDFEDLKDLAEGKPPWDRDRLE